MLQVGQKAPEFRVRGVLHGSVAEYSPTNLQGRWLVLFFYPADFSFICPTEVVAYSKMTAEFKAEQAEVWGVSVDSIESHIEWAKELGGIDCPLLSDEQKSLSRQYGVLHEAEGVSLRATFVLRPSGEIVYLVVSHANVGRSVAETLRVLKALRTERLCPSGWKPGDATGEPGLKY